VKLRWVLAACCLPSQVWAAKVTVDDLMRLRSLFDVRISPDGKRIAYVVSTPSIERAEHEAVLWMVSTAGGAPQRLTHSTRIFNQPVPSPCLRWSADGSLLSFVGYVNGVPQVLAMSLQGANRGRSLLSQTASRITNGRRTESKSLSWAPILFRPTSRSA